MMLQIPTCPARKLRHHHVTVAQKINIELRVGDRLSSRVSMEQAQNVNMTYSPRNIDLGDVAR